MTSRYSFMPASPAGEQSINVKLTRRITRRFQLARSACEFGQRQRPHEVAEIVGERMKLKADRVGREGSARQQAGPLDRALALFDVLLAGAAVVVEGDDPLARPRQVGNE